MFSVQTTYRSDRAEEESRPLLEVEDEIATLAANIASGMCRWLELLGEFDRRCGWSGWSSCAAWLAWRCGTTGRTAREHVRVAAALPGLPLIWAAFSRGELSYAKVRALSRVAGPETEEQLLGLADELTASQLERALRAYRRCTTEEARELHEAEELSWHWDEDGSLAFRGRLAPEDGALFLQAVEAATERLWQDGERARRGSAEPGDADLRPTTVDALLAVADAALAHEAPARGGGDRCLVVVHVDQAALTRQGEGACLLAEGPAIAPETARRLACDASLVTLTERSSGPLDVGRKTRTIPWPIRRALSARDERCRYPGCENRRFLDAHHIEHWADGGETKLDNLILLCRRHHRALHEGGYLIDQHGRFLHRHGWQILPAPTPPTGSLGPLRAARDDLGPTTLKNGRGDPMDVSMVVDSLVRIIQPGVTGSSAASPTEKALRTCVASAGSAP